MASGKKELLYSVLHVVRCVSVVAALLSSLALLSALPSFTVSNFYFTTRFGARERRYEVLPYVIPIPFW